MAIKNAGEVGRRSVTESLTTLFIRDQTFCRPLHESRLNFCSGRERLSVKGNSFFPEPGVGFS